MKYLGSLFGLILAVSIFGGTQFLRDIRNMIAVAHSRSAQMASAVENSASLDSTRSNNVQATPYHGSPPPMRSKAKRISKFLPPPSIKFDPALTYVYIGKGTMREYSGVELITKPKLRKRLLKSGYFMVKNGTDLSYPVLQPTSISVSTPPAGAGGASAQSRTPSSSSAGQTYGRDMSQKPEELKSSDYFTPKLMDRFERKIYTGQ